MLEEYTSVRYAICGSCLAIRAAGFHTAWWQAIHLRGAVVGSALYLRVYAHRRKPEADCCTTRACSVRGPGERGTVCRVRSSPLPPRLPSSLDFAALTSRSTAELRSNLIGSKFLAPPKASNPYDQSFRLCTRAEIVLASHFGERAMSVPFFDRVFRCDVGACRCT